jgi:hypothetical protein
MIETEINTVCCRATYMDKLDKFPNYAVVDTPRLIDDSDIACQVSVETLSKHDKKRYGYSDRGICI